jgi:hypothetical protein
MGAILSASIATTVPKLQLRLVYDPNNPHPYLDCNAYADLTVKGNYNGVIYYKCLRCGVTLIDGIETPIYDRGSFNLVGGIATLTIEGGIWNSPDFIPWNVQFRSQDWIGFTPQGFSLGSVGGKLGICE